MSALPWPPALSVASFSTSRLVRVTKCPGPPHGDRARRRSRPRTTSPEPTGRARRRRAVPRRTGRPRPVSTAARPPPRRTRRGRATAPSRTDLRPGACPRPTSASHARGRAGPPAPGGRDRGQDRLRRRAHERTSLLTDGRPREDAVRRRRQEVQLLARTDAHDRVGALTGDRADPRHERLHGRARHRLDLHPTAPRGVAPGELRVHRRHGSEHRVVRRARDDGEHVEVAARGREVPCHERTVHVETEQVCAERDHERRGEISEHGRRAHAAAHDDASTSGVQPEPTLGVAQCLQAGAELGDLDEAVPLVEGRVPNRCEADDRVSSDEDVCRPPEVVDVRCPGWSGPTPCSAKSASAASSMMGSAGRSSGLAGRTRWVTRPTLPPGIRCRHDRARR